MGEEGGDGEGWEREKEMRGGGVKGVVGEAKEGEEREGKEGEKGGWEGREKDGRERV